MSDPNNAPGVNAAESIIFNTLSEEEKNITKQAVFSKCLDYFYKHAFIDCDGRLCLRQTPAIKLAGELGLIFSLKPRIR